MASANHSIRKNAALAAVVTLTTALAAPLFCATAGFGGIWKHPAHYDETPILQCIDTTVYPGGTADCYVSLSAAAAPVGALRKHPGTTKDGTSYIHIYSEPAGVVSYDGPVNSSADVVSAAVSPDAPAGPVRVYLQTQDGAVVSDSTTVTQ